MKKSSIYIIVLIVAIVGLLIGIRFFSQTVVTKSLSSASTVARNASIRASTAMIIPYIEIWASENKLSYAGFMENPENFAKVKLIIEDREKGLNTKLRYNVSTTEKQYVVRIGIEGEALFYCADSTGVSTSEQTESVAGQFASKTNCDGQLL